MMGKKQIRELEDALSGVSGTLPTPSEDKFHFFKETYPYLKHRYESARQDVAKLGMTELIEAAIRDCLPMALQGRRDEAEDLLIDACTKLREKSGTFDEMRHLYTASDDFDSA
jgi:hypothetical protein